MKAATVCPLDCPDACSLAVTVQHGKIVSLDGSHKNPVTGGFICAKVRKFGERVYGPDRLLYPAVRKGRKGEGRFQRVTWDEALERIAERMRAAKDKWGGASILPYSYGGSNGLLTQDNLDAKLWRRFGTSRLARTVCAAPTGAANLADSTVASEVPGLSVVPSTVDLAGAELELIDMERREYRLRESIAAVRCMKAGGPNAGSPGSPPYTNTEAFSPIRCE